VTSKKKKKYRIITAEQAVQLAQLGVSGIEVCIGGYWKPSNVDQWLADPSGWVRVNDKGDKEWRVQEE
jgi:hypothetical protein